MLILIIKEDEYKLTKKNQESLKKELLSRYSDSDVVEITDSTGKVYDELLLSDLFNTK
jgi:hypothetical protein